MIPSRTLYYLPVYLPVYLPGSRPGLEYGEHVPVLHLLEYLELDWEPSLVWKLNFRYKSRSHST